MYILHGDFPLIGQYLPDKTNQQERIPFKCRIVSDAPQFFTTVLGGLMDIGTSLTIVTPKHLEYVTGARVIIDGVMYSVNSVTPYIPDQVAQGFVQRKLLAEYIIQLQ